MIVPPPPCKLCHKLPPACKCTYDLGPFELYNKYRIGCGSFTTIELALTCQAFLDKSSEGPCSLFDRHGLPIKLNEQIKRAA